VIRDTTQPESGTDKDSGAGLVALLVVVAALGAVTLIALAATSSLSTSTANHSSQTPTSLSPAPGQAETNIHQSQTVECESDYEAASAAADEYQALHGRAPTNMAEVLPALRNAPTGPDFTISIDANGKVAVSVPGHAPSTDDSNCRYATG
jgi:hypothetical protein